MRGQNHSRCEVQTTNANDGRRTEHWPLQETRASYIGRSRRETCKGGGGGRGRFVYSGEHHLQPELLHKANIVQGCAGH